MPRAAIQDPKSPPPLGAYSQAVRAGDFIYVTGTTPIDPGTGALVTTSVSAQTEQVIRNIEVVLKACGASLDDVVKSTVHLHDTAAFDEFNAVYERMFQAPYPVRTTVGSDLSQVPGMLVEVDCVAYIGP